MDLRKLLATWKAYRAGEPLGDVVVMKLDAYPQPRADVLRRLEAVCGYAPSHDLATLRALPDGTLGREYARFLDANAIEPLVVSPAVRERLRDRPYALRYTATHDLHHLITGFDTGLAGELGVLAFYVGQGSAPVGRGLLGVGKLLYAIVSPISSNSSKSLMRPRPARMRLSMSSDQSVPSRQGVHWPQLSCEKKRQLLSRKSTMLVVSSMTTTAAVPSPRQPNLPGPLKSSGQ